MKKTALRQTGAFAALFFSILVMLTITSPRADAASSSKSQVFSYLTESLGFNAAASCGIMANMEKESNFNPALVIIDCNGLPSGGLCQWNGSRYRSLINFCNNNGYNHLSIKGQLEYLKHELKKSEYKHIYNYLKNVPETSGGAYDAAYYWCYHFEVPRNRTSQSYSRASSAVNKYWPKFCANNISTVTPSSKADDKTLDVGRTININWNKATGNFTRYLALVATKVGDEFDWDNAKSYTFSTDTRRLSLDLSELGVGRYAVRVYAQNAANGHKGKCDNTIKFTVDCQEHQYTVTQRVEPTFSGKGKYIYTCAKCGEKTSVAVDPLSKEDFLNGTISNFDIAERTDETVTLTWSAYPGAQGYRIYEKENGAWVKLRRMEADELRCTVKNLQPGTLYSFKVAAYAKDGDDTLYCAGDTLAVYTRPSAVRLTDINNGRGKVWLQWEASKYADGYTIYAASKPGGSYEPVATVKGSVTETTIKPLDEGACYYFQVRAYITSVKGNKIYSDPSNVKYAVVW